MGQMGNDGRIFPEHRFDFIRVHRPEKRVKRSQAKFSAARLEWKKVKNDLRPSRLQQMEETAVGNVFINYTIFMDDSYIYGVPDNVSTYILFVSYCNYIIRM